MEAKIFAFRFNNTYYIIFKTQQQIWVFNSNGKVLHAMKVRERGVPKAWEEP